MPIVRRSEPDILRFASFTDVFVNPVSISGHMSSGLAKVFADRWPEMYQDYRKACAENRFVMGSLHIFYDQKSKNTIVNLPVKRDWRDTPDIVDIEAALIKLAAYLKQHPFYTVVMPMMGEGYSHYGPGGIWPLFLKYLEVLPNIIHLSISPEQFAAPPLYLGVVGSRAYTDYDRVQYGVWDGMIAFDKNYTDFEAMVSGGANGVDRIACGTGLPGDTAPNIAREHGLRAIVCHADWDRYQKSAGFVRNRVVQDIVTHVIAFVGSKSVGTRGLIDLVKRYNDNVDLLIAARSKQPTGDIFSKPPPPLPEKKQLYIHDISKDSV